MPNKKRYNITLEDETITFLDKIKKVKKFTSRSQAIDYIVSNYQNLENNEFADLVAKKIAAEYENLFTRMRLGINTADRNSQVILEILNSIVFSLGVDKAFDTEVMQTDVVRDSKQIVKDRIARYKELKDNKKN